MMVTFCAPAVAVDPTVTVTVAEVPGVIDAGLIVAVTPAAACAVRETAFFAVPLSVTPTVKVTLLPVCAVPDLADWVMAKFAPVVAPPPAAQLLSSTAPSTDPSPVARLYAAPLAVNPGTPGTLLLPEGVG